MRPGPSPAGSGSGGPRVAAFDPFDAAQLAGLLAPFGVPVPASFEPRPSPCVRYFFHLRADVRERFPLGLTPAGLRGYADWLFRHGRGEHDLRDDEVLGFLFAQAADPTCGLAETYLLTPAWQQAVPEAGSLRGWERLCDWVARRYPAESAGWIGRARACGAEALVASLFVHAGIGVGGTPPPAPPRDGEGGRRATPAGIPSFSPSPNRGGGRGVGFFAPSYTSGGKPGNGVLPTSGVNLLGHFRYESGLQAEAEQTAAALRAAGCAVARRDVPVAAPRGVARVAARAGLRTVPGVAPQARRAHERVDECYRRAGLHPRPGVYRVASWFWELDAFPTDALAHADLVDEVWAPTEFCAAAVRRVLAGRPVRVMPPAVPMPEFAPVARARFGLPDDRFLFYFAFDLASVMERKNPLGLIDAFRLAFRDGDRAHLAIKVSRGDEHPADLARLKAAAGPGVTVIDALLPRPEALGLLAACDAYVSLHRSEGLGLALAEAMLLGKPVVATGYSGNLDFMNSANSWLVGHRLVELDRDYPPYPAARRGRSRTCGTRPP